MNKLISCALLLLASLAIQAAEVPAAAESCAACHGADGQGNQALGAPRLAGQNEQYLGRQLQNFKTGRRGYAAQDQPGQRMAAFAMALSDAQIASLAIHYAELKLSRSPQPTNASAQAGAARYQDTCAVCHGQFAQGYEHLQAPNLRILDAWYLEQQLDSYAKGWRGADQYSDIQGKWMQSIATHINSKTRQEVIDFIGTLAE